MRSQTTRYQLMTAPFSSRGVLRVRRSPSRASFHVMGYGPRHRLTIPADYLDGVRPEVAEVALESGPDLCVGAILEIAGYERGAVRLEQVHRHPPVAGVDE
jgi:hypothetical protein